MNKYWGIEEGKVDGSQFFRLLPKYFPEATTFYAEGTSISRDLIEFYKMNFEDGDFLPRRQTIFPRSKKFRCASSHNFMNCLADLAEHHAEPELLDHLFLYKDEEPLIEWHDAFANAILISRKVSETIVAGFANELGLNYGKVDFG
jgi:hypothetical protein